MGAGSNVFPSRWGAATVKKTTSPFSRSDVEAVRADLDRVRATARRA